MMMAARGEFFLSEPIIHRIQSFLSGEEAARTTVLSKSWRQAWLTRPNLEFNRYDFYPVDEFLKLMEKTIQRYEESNLKIESFSLMTHSLNDLCDDLIIKAFGMGVTRLSLQLFVCSVLPAEVFGCKDLVELSLIRGRIVLDPEHQVQFPRLKALTLKWLQSAEVISGLLSGCPLLEKLALTSYVTIRLPNLPKLTHLELTNMIIDTSFSVDLSCKFPLLRDLSIHNCYFQGNLLISSPTIEYLYIETAWMTPVRVEFDVPSNQPSQCAPTFSIYRDSNIRKFEFKSWENLSSSLSFKPTCLREWESHLSIKGVGTLGIIGLNKLLTDLRHSKIHLLIEIDSRYIFSYNEWEFDDLTLHQVEELTIDGMDCNIPSLTSFALFDGLFRLCRPKFITQQNLQTPNYLSDFLFKTFLRHEINDHECSASSLGMHGLRHLEKVRAQIFDEDVHTWRLIPLDTWDALKDQNKIRFQLTWRDESQQVN